MASGVAAAGHTASRQPGESSMSSVFLLSPSLVGGRVEGPQGEVGRGLVDLVTRFAEWVKELSQGALGPSPAETWSIPG